MDDEAIAIPLRADQVNAIQQVVSDRHLQLFTSGSEWMVTGNPVTPANITLQRQTQIGSPVERNVPPLVIDGATVFAARGVSADAGSGEAVLLGLFDETEEEAEKRRELDNLRKNALASDLDNLNKRNLLEVSQLRERQRLNRMLF